MNPAPFLATLLPVAGLGQIVLMLSMTRLPRWLNWKVETAKLDTLTRQIFWMYAGYIFATNLFFGALTLAYPDTLIDRTPLATALTGYMCLYWGVRLYLQKRFIDKRAAPDGMFFAIGEMLLTIAFAFFAGVYAWATFYNFGE